jgi:hypothetical protein
MTLDKEWNEMSHVKYYTPQYNLLQRSSDPILWRVGSGRWVLFPMTLRNRTVGTSLQASWATRTRSMRMTHSTCRGSVRSSSSSLDSTFGKVNSNMFDLIPKYFGVLLFHPIFYLLPPMFYCFYPIFLLVSSNHWLHQIYYDFTQIIQYFT